MNKHLNLHALCKIEKKRPTLFFICSFSQSTRIELYTHNDERQLGYVSAKRNNSSEPFTKEGLRDFIGLC